MNFESQPDEIILQQVDQLPVMSLLQLCKTNKRLANLCQDNRLWAYLIQRDFNVVNFKQIYLKVYYLALKHLLEKMPPDWDFGLTLDENYQSWLESEEFREYAGKMKVDTITRLTEVKEIVIYYRIQTAMGQHLPIARFTYTNPEGIRPLDIFQAIVERLPHLDNNAYLDLTQVHKDGFLLDILEF